MVGRTVHDKGAVADRHRHGRRATIMIEARRTEISLCLLTSSTSLSRILATESQIYIHVGDSTNPRGFLHDSPGDPRTLLDSASRVYDYLVAFGES